MKRLLWRMGLLPVLIAAVLPCLAQDAAVFAKADPRLEQEVTLRADCLTMPQFAALLAKETGVEFSAETTLQDDLLVLSCAARPAAEVMRRVADHFGFSWSRVGEPPAYRYVLSQTRAALSIEDKAREERESRRVAVIQRALASMAEALSLDEATREAAAQEFQKSLDEALKAGASQDRIDEMNRGPGRYYLDLTQLRARLAALVGVTLDTSQWRRLRQGERLVFSTEPIRGEALMPWSADDVCATLLTAAGTAWENRAEQPLVITEGELQGFLPCGPDPSAFLENPAAEGLVNVQFQYWRGLLRVAITLRAEDRRPFLGASYYLKDTTPPDLPEPKDIEALAVPFEPSDELAALVAGRGASRRLRPGDWFRREWTAGQAREYVEPLSVAYGELLLEIADAASLPLIADAYDFHHMQPLVPAEGPASLWLDTLCTDAETEWAVEDKWIRLHHARHATMRALQIPQSVRRALYEAAAKRGSLTLEELAQAAVGMTREQRTSYQAFVTGLGLAHRQAGVGDLEWLAALGAMNSQTFRSLKTGQPLQVASLPHNVGVAIRTALEQAPIVPGVELPELMAGPGELVLTLSSSSEGDFIRYSEEGDTGPTLHRGVAREEALSQAEAVAAALRDGTPHPLTHYRLRKGRVLRYRFEPAWGMTALPAIEIELLEIPHGPSLAYSDLKTDAEKKLDALARGE